MKIDHEAYMIKNEGRRKAVFVITVIISFAAILVFNILTPHMSDDYSYGAEVNAAGSIAELFVQEYHQYMNWTGRSVVHMILRLFLMQPTIVFKVMNSIVFVLLTLLIYLNVRTEEDHRYNSMRFLLISLLLWLTGASFPQTVLWEVGACNYLWGTTIILAFVTLFRFGFRRYDSGVQTGTVGSILLAAAALIGGILAGWCNENTSGGGILITLSFLIFWIHDNKGEPVRIFLRPWMITGIAGQFLGFGMMVLAPGNSVRAAAISENHSGLYGMISRVQKVTLIVRDEFFWMIAAFIVCYILCRLQGKTIRELRNGIMFFVISILTSYAMALSPTQQERAFFGAGVFMLISLVQVIEEVQDSETWIILCRKSAVYIMLLYFAFTYIDCGAQNVRIYRDCSERVDYIEEQKAAGKDDITVPLIHKDFANRYTSVFETELSDDPLYWTNGQYESYFGVTSIRAIPYDDWEEKYNDK